MSAPSTVEEPTAAPPAVAEPVIAEPAVAEPAVAPQEKEAAPPSSPPQSSPPPSSPPRSAGIPVPLRWRIGQGIVIALIVLLAVGYNTVGWKSGAADGALARPGVGEQVGFAMLGGLVWLTTPIAGTIAMTTFHEALRRRWMLVLLGFSAVLLACFTFFSDVAGAGEEQNVLRDFGTGFIITITLLTAIFLGATLAPPEFERRTILTILAKPVTRLEFLLGKFLGLCLTLLLNLALLGAILLLSYAVFQIRRKGWDGAMGVAPNADVGLLFELGNLTRALVLHFGQLVVLSAMALTMSLIVSSITAVIFSFVAYLGGQMSSYWEMFGSGARTATENQPGVSKSIQGLYNVVYYALPRLDKFDVRERLINDTPISFDYLWKAWGGGLIYAAILLTIGYLVFSDREF